MSNLPISGLPDGTPADTNYIPQADTSISQTQKVSYPDLVTYINEKLTNVEAGRVAVGNNPESEGVSGYGGLMYDVGSETLIAQNIRGGNGLVQTGVVHTDSIGKFTTSQVVNSDMANMPSNTIKGNNNTSSDIPKDLTASQVKSLLNITSNDIPDLGFGFLNISSNVDYVLTNPCNTNIKASFSTSSKNIIFPVMNSSNSLNNVGVGRVFIYNNGSNSFGIKNNSGSLLLSSINPGELYLVTVNSNSTSDGQFSFYLLSTLSDAGITKGYLSISQSIDYTLSNPTPNRIDVNFLVATGRSLILAPMNQSNSPKTAFTIHNSGTVAFILKNNSSSILYSQVLPGQTIILYPKDFSTPSGDFDLLNENIDPVDGGVPYAVLGGSPTLTSSSLFTYDAFNQRMIVPKILSGNTISALGYVEITSGVNVGLSNPMYTFINVLNAGTGISISLPPMNQALSLLSYPLGIFYIYNNGGADVIIKDNGGGIITTINVGKLYLFVVTSNLTSNGSFIFYDVTPINIPYKEVPFGPPLGNGLVSNPDFSWDDTQKRLILENSSGAPDPGILLPTPTLTATPLHSYSQDNIFLINVDGPWGTKPLSVEYTLVGNQVTLTWGPINADTVATPSKIQSQNPIPSAFRPPQSQGWQIKTVDGTSVSSVNSGDFYIDSSFFLQWTSQNNTNFSSTYCGLISSSITWLV